MYIACNNIEGNIRLEQDISYLTVKGKLWAIGYSTVGYHLGFTD